MFQAYHDNFKQKTKRQNTNYYHHNLKRILKFLFDTSIYILIYT